MALVIFSLGSLFALFEAEEKLRKAHELESAGWAVAILVVAIVFESFSFRTAVHEGRRAKGERSWWLIDEAETRIRAAVPEARVIYLEPDVARPAQPPGDAASG